MDTNFYQIFYTVAVLPQFGVDAHNAVWGERRQLGPDESAYPFAIADTRYILIFEDCGGLGFNHDYVQQYIAPEGNFEFVRPLSKSNISPSYNGFHLPVPYSYVPEITGTFTLIRLV